MFSKIAAEKKTKTARSLSDIMFELNEMTKVVIFEITNVDILLVCCFH